MLIKGDILENTYEYLLMDNKSPFAKSWTGPKISYSINQQGYRCPNWDQINWNESILVFGGSNVFGIGVSECQTLSSCISRLTNINAVNLGQPATGPAFQWANSLRLLEQGVKPKGVVYIWPNEFRYLEFTDNTGIHVKNVGPWTKNSYIKEWISHPYQAEMTTRFFIESMKYTWDCPIAQFRLIQSDANSPLEELDRSRDRQHPGPKSYELWADVVVNELFS